MITRFLGIGVPLAVAVVAGLVTVVVREDDPVFILAQQHPTQVEGTELARIVQKAPEPVAHPGPVAGTRATCRPLGRGDLQNPWSCLVRYPGGTRMRFRITIQPRGAYRGRNGDGSGIVSGCCVSVNPLG